MGPEERKRKKRTFVLTGRTRITVARGDRKCRGCGAWIGQNENPCGIWDQAQIMVPLAI